MLKKHKYLFFIVVMCLFMGLCGCDKDGKENDKGQNTVAGSDIVSEADNGWTENIVIVDEPDDEKDLSDQRIQSPGRRIRVRIGKTRIRRSVKVMKKRLNG